MSDSGKSRQRVNDPDTNPCLKEARLSLKCLERYNYNNDKCTLYFENYKRCKQFWGNIMNSRSKAGIVPAMPTEKERILIRAERDKGNKVISVEMDEENSPVL